VADLGFVHAVASFGLKDHGAPIQVPAAAWPAALADVTFQKLTGLASAAAEAGALALDFDQSDELRERHRRVMAWDLLLESRLLQLDDAFVTEAIEHVVLKGPAVARVAYPDPSWRAFADLDILVHGSDFRRACEVVASFGFRRIIPEPRRGFDERFGKAAAHRNDEGMEIDLHRTLVVGPFGLWIRPDQLFAETDWFELGGRKLRRLNDTAMFLHACLHAALGADPPLMLPVRDVAQTMALPDLDWDAVEGLCRRWRVTAPIQRALVLATNHLGVPLPGPATDIEATRVPQAEVRALTSYSREGRPGGGTAVGTLRAISGLGGKAAYLAALLVPRREFLTSRYPEGRAYGRRWMQPARWAVDRAMGRTRGLRRPGRT